MITKKNLQEAIDEATADIISAVTKGFETVTTKEELKHVKEELGGKIDELSVRINRVENEVKDVKRTINDLNADVPSPQEFADHEKRITKLETTAFPQ